MKRLLFWTPRNLRPLKRLMQQGLEQVLSLVFCFPLLGAQPLEAVGDAGGLVLQGEAL